MSTKAKSKSKGTTRRVSRKPFSGPNLLDLPSFGAPLPFRIVGSGACSPDCLPRERDRDDYDWCRNQSRVADAALRAGFHLMVPAAAEGIVQAVCAVMRAIGRPVCAGYRSDLEQLILWDAEAMDREDGGE